MVIAEHATRSSRKRQAILQAATTAFLSKGYDGTSMDDIAALAEVSKPTVYKHFADKEQLFAQIILATTAQTVELVRLAAETFGDLSKVDLEKDLRSLAQQFISRLMQPELLRLRRLVIANAERFPNVSRAWYQQGFERALATLAKSFLRLSQLGLLQIDDPVLAANHYVGMLLWIPVNRAMFSGDNPYSASDLKRYADAAVDAFLAAYRRPQPPEKRS